MFGGVRVEVVPDDDAKAHPDIPKDVLAALTADTLLMSTVGHMMYVRASAWERMKHRFPVKPEQLAHIVAVAEKLGLRSQ